MKTKITQNLTALMLCLASLTAFGQQGETHLANATYTPSNDNYGSVIVHYDYAFNGTQLKIKMTQIVVDFSVAMAQNEPELHNELRKRGILPLTQQSGAGVTIKYEGQVWFADNNSRFPVSGSVSGTMTDYTFFEPDEAIKKRNRIYYEKYKTNYYSDKASLMSFTITDVQYPDLDRKIAAVRQEIAERKKNEKAKQQSAQKEKEVKEKAEKEKQVAQEQQPTTAQNNSITDTHTASESLQNNNNSFYDQASQNSSNSSSSTGNAGPYKDPELNAKYAEAQRKKQEQMREMKRKLDAMEAEQRRVNQGLKEAEAGIEAMASGFSSGTMGSNGLLSGSKEFIEGVAKATGSVDATIGAGVLAVGASIFSSAKKDKAQREAAERAEAERRRLEEQREAERKRREAERERLRQEAFALLISQRHTILNTFGEQIPIPLSTTNVESDIIYYFIYAYEPTIFEKKNAKVYVSNVFAIARYNDGTWPYQSKIENEIKDLTPYAELMHGYYLDAATAKEMQKGFVDGFYQNEGVEILNISYREESLEASNAIQHKTDGSGLGIRLGDMPKTTTPAKSQKKGTQSTSLGIPLN